MSAEIERNTVESFYRAIAERDRERMLSFFDDDATWAYWGPPDVLPFCGQLRGKAAVGEVYRRMFEFIDVSDFKTTFLVVEDDRSAAMIGIRGTLSKSGRIATARVAHFIRWRADCIVEFHALLDSLDHVEQVLGHELVPSAA
jgi:ketosteroid isomerase-like protein